MHQVNQRVRVANRGQHIMRTRNIAFDNLDVLLDVFDQFLRSVKFVEHPHSMAVDYQLAANVAAHEAQATKHDDALTSV